MRHRHLGRAAAAVVVTCLLVGCASGTSDEAAAPTPHEPVGQSVPDPLKVVGPFELHSIDPATAGGFFTRLQVTETLVDADTNGDLRPGLARAWEASDDQLVWRFVLRPGATFHDGTPVDAAAVAASLDAVRMQPESPLSSAPIVGVAAEGQVVEVTLEDPFAPLPAVLAHTSTQVLAPSSYDAAGEVTQVLGTGPYEVARIRQPDRIELVASEHWQGERPAIRAVQYEAVGRAETRALMAESGQSHVTFGMDPVSLQRLRDADRATIVSVTLPRTIQFKVNAGHPALNDVRVRRALSLALDREAMAEALLRDPQMAATQLFPPSLERWHQPSIDPLVHDPETARALLADAGWEPGPDGILVREGQRFVLTLLTFTDRPELPTLATAIQAAFAQVGIKLDVRIGNSGDIPAGHEDGSLQLGLFARNFALVPDPLVTLLGDFGPEGADWGAMGWSDPELTRLLAETAADAEATDDPSSRQQIAEILQQELPVVPVAWYRQSAAVDRRLDRFELDPLERSWLLADLSWGE